MQSRDSKQAIPNFRQTTKGSNIMDKLIINATFSTCRNAIITFIRAGFAVDAFAIRNGLLIAEISKYQGVAVSKCNIDTIAQSIYEIVTAAGIDNITAEVGSITFAIDADDCSNVTNIVTLDYVYEVTDSEMVKQDRAIRATLLAQYYAIVQAEALAADIAANIHFKGYIQSKYHVDYVQYDASTLCNKLAQLGIKSYPIVSTHSRPKATEASSKNLISSSLICLISLKSLQKMKNSITQPYESLHHSSNLLIVKEQS